MCAEWFYSRCALIIYETTRGTTTIIIDKQPNNNKIKLMKLMPIWIAVKLFPRTISTGSAKGIVINAPNTDPLLRLNALPKTNKFKNI